MDPGAGGRYNLRQSIGSVRLPRPARGRLDLPSGEGVGSHAASSYQGLSLMPKVNFVKEKKEIEVPQGANLRQEAAKNGIVVYKGLSRYLNCLGHGTCGTCRVLVKEGMV